MSKQEKKIRLPPNRAVEEAIDTIHGFRDLCKHKLDAGHWATTDFPSKHHINNLLQLQYRKVSELQNKYGRAQANVILETIPYCKSYLAFLRDEEQ